MGDRGQVHIVDTGVWIYTHWGATTLPEVLYEALAEEARWNDPEYLARIIFDTMVGDSQGSHTGFGIGEAQHGDVWRVAHVNCSEGTVTLEASAAPWHDGDDEVTNEYTFEEYLNTDRDVSWPER